jgi:predicted acetyltransferase
MAERSAIPVRACANADEMRAAFAPIWHYFGQTAPSDDAVKHFRRVMTPDRVFAAFEGEKAVAGSGAFAFDLTVPGGQVKASGVTIVGVLPTHRRRGLMSAMMRAQIDAARERGEPVAVLWPSEDAIYGRFGFGMASQAAEIDLPREHAAPLAAIEPAGEARLVSLADAEPLVTAVYDQVARVTPGMFARDAAWWQDRVLNDMDWKRRGGGALQCAVLDIGGKPAAYALYRVNSWFERGSPTGHVSVVEAMGATPEATFSIWRYLIGIDLVARVKAIFLPVDHPLLLSLAHPRRLNFLVREGIWIRLIEVGTALSARRFAGEGAVAIELADAFCSWNAGRWRVSAGGVERTDAEADLACDASALACVYLGGFTFAELARALRVKELRAGGLARADALFRTDRAPWCPELF